MQAVSSEDYLHESPKHIFWENKTIYHKFVVCWVSSERDKNRLPVVLDRQFKNRHDYVLLSLGIQKNL